MFNIESPLRRLKVRCPVENCNVVNCPFVHKKEPLTEDLGSALWNFDIEGDDEYSFKLRREFARLVKARSSEKNKETLKRTIDDQIIEIPGKKARTNPKKTDIVGHEVTNLTKDEDDSSSAEALVKKDLENNTNKKENNSIKALKRKKSAEFSTEQKDIARTDSESSKSLKDSAHLVPRAATRYAAAPQQQRQTMLNLIHKQLRSSFPSSSKVKILYNRAAISLEWHVSEKSTNLTYSTGIRGILTKIRSKDQGLLKKYNLVKSIPSGKETSARVDVQKEMLPVLEKRLHPLSLLVENDYIMEIPSIKEPEPFATKICERCGAKFCPDKSFKGNCTHHPGAKLYQRDSQGKLYYTLSCCQKLFYMNTAENNNNDLILGCTKKDLHVFKDSEPELIHYWSNFKTTKSLTKPSNKYSKHPVIGLDAEMIYTTKGFELARLTMVDYFTNESIYDKLVKPVGEVIDFNTRFSGISSLEGAISFDQCISDFMDFVDGKKSILIGHGLENDMNVLRVIHTRIIDTAILYKTGLRKPGLKILCEKFLNREIQSGEHDSAEDSIAAIDLVKRDVRRFKER